MPARVARVARVAGGESVRGECVAPIGGVIVPVIVLGVCRPGVSPWWIV